MFQLFRICKVYFEVWQLDAYVVNIRLITAHERRLFASLLPSDAKKRLTLRLLFVFETAY